MYFLLTSKLWLALAIFILKEHYVESADCTALPGAAKCTLGPDNNCPISSNPLNLAKCLPSNCLALTVPANCKCLPGPGGVSNTNCLLTPPKFCSCRANCQPAGATCTLGSANQCLLSVGNCKKDCTAVGQVCQVIPGFESVNSNTACLLTQGGTCVNPTTTTTPPGGTTTTPPGGTTTTAPGGTTTTAPGGTTTTAPGGTTTTAPGATTTPATTTAPYYPPYQPYYPPYQPYYAPSQYQYQYQQPFYPPNPYYSYQQKPYPQYYQSAAIPQYNQYMSSPSPGSYNGMYQPYGKKK